jgi:hypothetical protein
MIGGQQIFFRVGAPSESQNQKCRLGPDAPETPALSVHQRLRVIGKQLAGIEG